MPIGLVANLLDKDASTTVLRCGTAKSHTATLNGASKANLNFPNYWEGSFATSFKMGSVARPKGTNTKVLVRCHEDIYAAVNSDIQQSSIELRKCIETRETNPNAAKLG